MQHDVLVRAHRYQRDPTRAVDDLALLIGFLRGELAAIAAYRRGITAVRHEGLREQLVQLMRSHDERANMLRDRIMVLGGHPVTSAGSWGVIATVVQRGAGYLGERAALFVLRDGERHGRVDYERCVDKLGPLNRAFVQERLIPEQRRTAFVMHQLAR